MTSPCENDQREMPAKGRKSNKRDKKPDKKKKDDDRRDLEIWMHQSVRASEAGERVVADIVDVVVDCAVVAVCEKQNSRLCAAFSAMCAAAAVWKVLATVPPLLRREKEAGVAAPKIDEFPAPLIDVQAALCVPQGRRPDERPVSRRRRPSLVEVVNKARDPRKPTTANHDQRVDLFRLVDSHNRGTVTAEQVHAWLTLQGGVSLSDVKKLVANEQCCARNVDAQAFAGVLAALEVANPARWGASERLCVYSVPKQALDPQLLADEQELSEILQQREKDRRNLVAGPLADDDDDVTVDWGKTEVVSGPQNFEKLRDDRLQGIAAQVKITSPARKSRPASAFSRSDNKRPASRASSSSTNYGPLRISLARSGDKLDLAFEASPRFVPVARSQTSLVESFDFVPEAGVSATDTVGRTHPKKVITRAGPAWPIDPNHMTKRAYNSMRALPSSLDAAGPRPSTSSVDTAAPQTRKAPTRRKPCIIGRTPASDDDTVRVEPIAAEFFPLASIDSFHTPATLETPSLRPGSTYYRPEASSSPNRTLRSARTSSGRMRTSKSQPHFFRDSSTGSLRPATAAPGGLRPRRLRTPWAATC